jgi:hypothetical protein
MSSVFADQFYHTFSGQVYAETSCLLHEHSIAQLFYSMLINLGYRTNDPDRRLWKRNNKAVVVCLSDDFTLSRTIRARSFDQCFEPDTVVITDNYTQFQPQYTVLRVPDSYFGIYNYVPEISEFCPTKRFNFSVNRIDQKRELILLELIKQSGEFDRWLQQDHVNFNCYDPNGENESVEDIKTNFLKFWPALSQFDPEYSNIVSQLLDQLPLRTHQLTIEQAHVSAYLNLVVESYTGDKIIALSEKIFRALTTPAPWTLFGCIGTVDWLVNLGFDVLADIVDHEYNTVLHDVSNHGLKKIRAYISSSIEISKKLENMDLQQLKTRCKTAAEHNQQLLVELQQRWPADFANWLPTAIDKIAGK